RFSQIAARSRGAASGSVSASARTPVTAKSIRSRAPAFSSSVASARASAEASTWERTPDFAAGRRFEIVRTRGTLRTLITGERPERADAPATGETQWKKNRARVPSVRELADSLQFPGRRLNGLGPHDVPGLERHSARRARVIRRSTPSAGDIPS